MAKIYHVPLFEAEYLSATELLPTEYVYFYLHADEAAAKLNSAGSTRGEAVAEQESRFFALLAMSNGDDACMLERYDDYLAERQATYFRLETGEGASRQDVAQARSELYQKAAGYDRIAVDVMRAIAGNERAVFPVDVANQGSISHFKPNDVVEVPCEINERGARPLPVGSVPESVRPLLTQVKEYERLTAQAALSGSLSMAAEALRVNSLVGERVDAMELALEYRESHRDLGYLR